MLKSRDCLECSHCSLPGYSPFGFPAQALHMGVGAPTVVLLGVDASKQIETALNFVAATVKRHIHLLWFTIFMLNFHADPAGCCC